MAHVIDSINKKCEDAFKSYLDAQTYSHKPSGFTFIQGLREGERVLPACIIEANDLEEAFPDSAVYRGPITFEIRTNRGDTTGDQHAACAGEIWDFLTNPANIMTALNKSVTPPDNRTVKSFYIQYSSAGGVEYEPDDNWHMSRIALDVVVQGHNHIA